MNPDRQLCINTLLPPGRLITSDQGDGDTQPLWLSEEPASADLWTRLLTEHRRTGLWPLLLDSSDPYGSEFRPWATGEVFPEGMSSPDAHDPVELLAKWWSDYTATGEGDDMPPACESLSATASFGQSWPGLTPSMASAADPHETAAEYARHFASRRPQSRLGLVPAQSGAHAITVLGWDGPLNYDNDTAKFSAVVRDWERRFGALVVGLGPDTLHLSVAAPPMNTEYALLVAAEHFAFCPDNVWQGTHPHTLAAYSERLVGTHCWEFWWD
ncbi:DUF4253 domain-containing protein [Streptomyces syringium]|uniref:DUF4253 domain-containing protein n=1 Tax=Streptomyces syringium TaxID=76729 RepID=UPI00367B0D72